MAMTQLTQSKHILGIALLISLAVHSILVLFNDESHSIQSGSSSTVSVSVKWSDVKSDTKTDTKKVKKVHAVEKKKIKQKEIEQQKPKKKKIEQKKPKKQTIEKVLQHKQTTRSNVASTVSTAKHKTVHEVTKAKHVPATMQTSSITPKPEQVEEKPIEKPIEKPQPVRYQIGSNNNPMPAYPSIAVKKGWQGEVILGVYVKPDGSIEHLTFVKSTDYGVLNFEAYETVRTSWKFKPVTPHSSGKSSYIEVPIRFDMSTR